LCLPKFKIDYTGTKIKNKSSEEPGMDVQFYFAPRNFDMKIKFCTNDCPMAFWVYFLEDQNLT
jgi:hypothetical protein